MSNCHCATCEAAAAKSARVVTGNLILAVTALIAAGVAGYGAHFGHALTVWIFGSLAAISFAAIFFGNR